MVVAEWKAGSSEGPSPTLPHLSVHTGLPVGSLSCPSLVPDVKSSPQRQLGFCF